MGVDQVCTEAHVGTTTNVLGHSAAGPLLGAIAGSRFVKREADAEADADAQGLTPADYAAVSAGYAVGAVGPVAAAVGPVALGHAVAPVAAAAAPVAVTHHVTTPVCQ